MITFTILAILGVLLGFVLYLMTRGPRQPQLPGGVPAQALPASAPTAEVQLNSARPGDVISIHGAAQDFSDVDFTVDRRSAYESNNRRWVDLSGEYRGNRVYIEVHQHPDPEVMGIVDPRRLTLPDIGVTEDELAQMDARQDPSATLSFEGRRWFYESSREIGYFENERSEGEGLYRWLFREQDGPHLLCVEKWEGEPFDVRIARRFNPQDIAIYRAA